MAPSPLRTRSGLTTSALFSWMLGLPDRSSERARQSIALSTRLGHPSSMAYASFHAGLIDLWNRADALALERAEVVARLAEEYELPIWGAVGSCVRGRAQAGLGSADEGLAVIKGAMATYQRLPTPPVFWPLLLHLQAGACALAGRPADGLALLDEALSITEGSGFVLSPEFLRLKGQLLLARSPDAAESEFRRAVVSASNAAAPMLQLRAVLPLAALWRDQGRIEEARQLLRPTYDRFTEGFATADLGDARALLEELEATG